MLKITNHGKHFNHFELWLETGKRWLIIKKAKQWGVKRGVKRKRYNPFLEKHVIDVFI